MVEKTKNYLRKYFSNGPKAVFIAMLVLVSMTICIVSTRKEITVSIDGKETTIVTFRDTLRSALKANNIVLGPKDKTTPGLDSSIKDKDKVFIKKAVNIKVAVDGKEIDIQSAEDNVEKMLSSEGIKIGEYDKIAPSKDETLKNKMKIAVTRVEIKTVKDVKSIEYGTVVKKDNNLEEGIKKVVQEGASGEKLTTTKVVYENGKETSRKLVSEVVTKKPIEKIVAMGTLGVFSPSRGGESIRYNKKIKMRATAYTSDIDPTTGSPDDNGFTATGKRARRNPNGYSSVAVDPRVIPLGTKVYVEGYGYGIAEDVGGAVKGNVIDLFFTTYSQAYQWGARSVDVYILK